MADDNPPRTPAYNGERDNFGEREIQRQKIARAFKKKRDQWAEDRKQLETDLAEARKAAGAVEELAALKAQVKLEKHRGAFDKIAKEEGVRAKALDDLWEKSGYNMPGDVPDEGAIRAAIARQKVDRDYLFEPPGDNGQGGLEEGSDMEAGPTAEQPRPGPARGQGGTHRSNGSGMQLTEAQMADPAWMFANQAKIAAAAQKVADLPISQVGTKFTIM